jgi:hypothetical protein
VVLESAIRKAEKMENPLVSKYFKDSDKLWKTLSSDGLGRPLAEHSHLAEVIFVHLTAIINTICEMSDIDFAKMTRKSILFGNVMVQSVATPNKAIKMYLIKYLEVTI